jgi:hypothetical protein
MGELEERAVGAEAATEGGSEHERVRRDVPARVVSDQQRRPSLRDALEPANLGAEPRV